MMYRFETKMARLMFQGWCKWWIHSRMKSKYWGVNIQVRRNMRAMLIAGLQCHQSRLNRLVQDIRHLRNLVQHIRCIRVIRKSPKSQMLHHRCFRFQHIFTWGMLQQLNFQDVQPKRDSIRHLITHPRHLHRPVIGMEVEGDHLIVEGDYLRMTVQHRPDLGEWEEIESILQLV